MLIVTYHELGTMDEIITKISSAAIKKVEGIRRNILFSQEKKRTRAALLRIKIQIRKIKGIKVDKDTMKKERRGCNRRN